MDGFICSGGSCDEFPWLRQEAARDRRGAGCVVFVRCVSGDRRDSTAGQPASLTEAKAEPLLPPSGPFKPSTIEIQTALKNAGFYLDEVDGKLGPRTRKAIEDFQSGHNLKADGKVGPQTWSVLQGYLNPPAAQETKKAKKR